MTRFIGHPWKLQTESRYGRSRSKNSPAKPGLSKEAAAMNKQHIERRWGRGYRCRKPKAFGIHPFFRQDRPGYNRDGKYHRRRWMRFDCHTGRVGMGAELEMLEQLAIMVEDDARLYFDCIRGAVADP